MTTQKCGTCVVGRSQADYVGSPVANKFVRTRAARPFVHLIKTARRFVRRSPGW